MPKTAAVCRKGHVVSVNVIDPAKRVELADDLRIVRRASSSLGPQSRWDPDAPRPTSVIFHCGDCGAVVLTRCPACEGAIPAPTDGLTGVPNAFCVFCGEPFPWATRRQLVAQLEDRLDMDPLTPAQKLDLKEDIQVLSAPEGEVPEARRVRAAKRLGEMAPKAVAAAGPLLRSVATDVVLKALGLG